MGFDVWTQKDLAKGKIVLEFALKKTLKFLVKFVYSEKVTKFCEIFILLLSTVHTDKSKVKISQNFVAFTDYMNLNSTSELLSTNLQPQNG